MSSIFARQLVSKLNTQNIMVINTHLKSILAVASFLAAIAFGVWGMILPPPG